MSTLFVNTITPNSGDTVTVSGSLTTTGKLTIGDASTDTVAITAEITSSLIPDLDDKFDLGSSTKQWKDLYIDGIANIDSASIDSASIGVVVSDLIPTKSGFMNLGSTQNKWNNIYWNGFAYGQIISLTGQLTVGTRADIPTASIDVVSSSLIPHTGATYALGTMANSWGSAHIHGLAHIHTASLNVVSSSLLPDADNTYDLGAAGIEWKDLYIDGTANLDTITSSNADINIISSSGIHVGGTSGTATFPTASVDRFTSSLIPANDDVFDLGGSVNQWRNLYIDGTAFIDTIAPNANCGQMDIDSIGTQTISASVIVSSSVIEANTFTLNKSVLGNGDIATISGSNSAATLYATQLQAQLNDGAFAEFIIQNTAIKATSHCLGAIVVGPGNAGAITGSIVTVATQKAGTASFQIHNETGVNIADNTGFTASLLIL